MTLMKICVFAFPVLSLLLIRKSLAVRSTKLGFEGFGCRWRKVVKTCHSNLPSNTFLCTHRTHTSTMKLPRIMLVEIWTREENSWRVWETKQQNQEWVSEWVKECERKKVYETENVANYTPLCSSMFLDRQMFIYAFSTRERGKAKKKSKSFSFFAFASCSLFARSQCKWKCLNDWGRCPLKARLLSNFVPFEASVKMSFDTWGQAKERVVQWQSLNTPF